MISWVPHGHLIQSSAGLFGQDRYPSPHATLRPARHQAQSRRSSRLVRPPPAGPAVAREAGRNRRPVSGLAVRDHAAADHGRGGQSPSTCAFSTAFRPSRPWPRPPSIRSCRPGPGSAIIPAPATSMPAPRRWSSASAATFPPTEAELLTLPGIGAYTAAAVAAIAFNRAGGGGGRQCGAGRVAPFRRRGAAAEGEAADPGARPLDLVPPDRPGDFAQAVMDLGATICTPKRPACALCPWMAPCRARADGPQELYPKKQKKVDRRAAPRRRLRGLACR